MLYLITSFLVSFVFCFVFMNSNHKHFVDVPYGVQKFHYWQAPRVGGLAVFLSLVFAGFVFWWRGKPFFEEFFKVIVSSFPVFLGGIAEDLTKKVAPKVRLFLAFVSGLLACFLLDFSLLLFP